MLVAYIGLAREREREKKTQKTKEKRVIIPLSKGDKMNAWQSSAF